MFQVINIINAAQEDSPNAVVQALDRVLEILRSSELYSPYLNMKQDPITNDLVGGLMTVGAPTTGVLATGALVACHPNYKCLAHCKA